MAAKRKYSDSLVLEAQAMRDEGMTYRAIGEYIGLTHVTVQKMINPNFGLMEKRPKRVANDNYVTRTMPHNGGWSTAENPHHDIKLQRVSFIEGAAA